RSLARVRNVSNAWHDWQIGLCTLQLLRPVVADLDDVVSTIDVMAAGDAQRGPAVRQAAAAAARLAGRLWADGLSLPEFVAERVLWTEHPLAQRVERSGANGRLPAAMLDIARRELRLLQDIAYGWPGRVDAALVAAGWPGDAIAWPSA